MCGTPTQQIHTNIGMEGSMCEHFSRIPGNAMGLPKERDHPYPKTQFPHWQMQDQHCFAIVTRHFGRSRWCALDKSSYAGFKFCSRLPGYKDSVLRHLGVQPCRISAGQAQGWVPWGCLRLARPVPPVLPACPQPSCLGVARVQSLSEACPAAQQADGGSRLPKRLTQR